MAANACSAWDNSRCEGSDHCPPRCPRFVDDEGTPVVIRPYGPDRRDALLAMYEAIERSTMGLPPKDRDELERWIGRLASDGWNLIATVGDDVVGHVAVTPADTDDPEIVIFVRPGFRNRGIGSELLEHVVAHAADRGHDELQLTVSRDHARAIAVYEKIGFGATDVNEFDVEMKLPLEEPLVTTVRQPPAARD